MSRTRIVDALEMAWKSSRGLALAWALLVAFVAIPLHAQSYQDLYDFNCPTGCSPYDFGRLTQGTDGYLYGTTGYGGPTNHGVIFKVNTTGTSYVPLFYFDSANSGGYLPTAALTLSSLDGNFYGTTAGGGTSSKGTLFRFNPKTSALTTLHSFSSTEGSPSGPPAEAKNFKLYGVTNLGATYVVTVGTATYNLLPHTTPGAPSGPLLAAADGYLYGATLEGGKYTYGTIFRLSTTNGNIAIIYNKFNDPDGIEPNGPLAQGKNGDLYGTTIFGGGALDQGTIFDLTLPPPPATLTTLHSFDGTDGGRPSAGLLAASDGNFYGTTSYGGADGVGTIFQVSAGGVFTSLFDFTGSGGVVSGGYPDTTLLEDTNGVFYGLTNGGGANGVGDGDGVFYSLTPPNPLTHISLCCNWWVILDQPVTIIGQNLTGVVAVSFGSVAAQFRQGSDTYLIAEVPSAAVDSIVTVTLATGEQVESQQVVRILPKITNLDPSSGPVGTQVGIVGGGFIGTTKVTFGGVAATTFTVDTPSLIRATVPAGAVTGKVGVTTPNGTALSKEIFTVN
jgi:uncharacterized repeat protein (TIGR03803 family)